MMSNSKLLYVHNGDFPSTAANRMQVINMCEAFTSNKVDTTLLAFGEDPSHIYQFYNIKDRFKIVLLRFQKNYYSRTLSLFKQFRKMSNEFDNIFTRDLIFAYLVKKFYPQKKVIYELHDFSNGPAWKFMFRRAFDKMDHIVVISSGIKDDMVSNGYETRKISILPDAVNIRRFDIKITKKDARKKLNLPKDKKIISYVGSTDYERDLPTLIKASKQFPDVLFLIYGNKKPYLIEAVKDLVNVKLMGYTTSAELVYKASDILFSGYTNMIKTIRYMSPLKIFEYMVSKTPIVVADFPRIRDILDEKDAALYCSEDSDDLVNKIALLLKSKEMQSRFSKSSFKKVQSLTWVNRAKKIWELYL
jgi:glycosyltransferase involved in cell wall biosynthesis